MEFEHCISLLDNEFMASISYLIKFLHFLYMYIFLLPNSEKLVLNKP